jgi:hypothetical protein
MTKKIPPSCDEGIFLVEAALTSSNLIKDELVAIWRMVKSLPQECQLILTRQG